jgi:hypothetical protein
MFTRRKWFLTRLKRYMGTAMPRPFISTEYRAPASIIRSRQVQQFPLLSGTDSKLTEWGLEFNFRQGRISLCSVAQTARYFLHGAAILPKPSQFPRIVHFSSAKNTLAASWIENPVLSPLYKDETELSPRGQNAQRISLTHDLHLVQGSRGRGA